MHASMLEPYSSLFNLKVIYSISLHHIYITYTKVFLMPLIVFLNPIKKNGKQKTEIFIGHK